MGKLNAELLSRLSPLENLSAERLAELANCCRSERVPRGGDPLRLHSGADQAVYLLQGELRLRYGDDSSAVLVGGTEAAAWPLARREPLPVEVVAITDVELVYIDDQLLDILLTWDQLAANATALPAAGSTKNAKEDAETTDWRLMSGAFNVQVLTASALAQLPPAHIDVLLQRFARQRVAAGEVVIREGDAGDAYYLIESGCAMVTRRVAGSDMPLAELRPGDAFGEEALVANARRNASVTMKTSGVLLKLGQADFDALLRAPLLKGLPLAEAQQRIDGGEAVWLDVRYPAEFRYDGFAGALNIPVNEIRNAFGVLDPQRKYIVYCQSGRRSSAAAFLLTQHGYQAWWLEGGLWGSQLPQTKDQE